MDESRFLPDVAAMSDDEIAAELKAAAQDARKAWDEQKVLAAKRDRLAWTLHSRGWTYAEISRLLGVARSRAQKMCEDGKP